MGPSGSLLANPQMVVFKFLCHFFKLYQKEMIYDHTYFWYQCCHSSATWRKLSTIMEVTVSGMDDYFKTKVGESLEWECLIRERWGMYGHFEFSKANVLLCSNYRCALMRSKLTSYPPWQPHGLEGHLKMLIFPELSLFLLIDVMARHHLNKYHPPDIAY